MSYNCPSSVNKLWLAEEYGPVITIPKQEGYIGATRGTNNTGELTALHGALVRAKGLTSGTPRARVLILTDSRLALCTTGAWAARSHKAIVARNRAALAALKAAGAKVTLQHVRAHRGHGMNERADKLARLGALGAHLRDGRPPRTPAAAPRPPPPPSAPPPPTAPSLPPDHVPD